MFYSWQLFSLTSMLGVQLWRTKAAIMSHHRRLRQLVRQYGGFDKFDPYSRNLLLLNKLPG